MRDYNALKNSVVLPAQLISLRIQGKGSGRRIHRNAEVVGIGAGQSELVSVEKKIGGSEENTVGVLKFSFG